MSPTWPPLVHIDDTKLNWSHPFEEIPDCLFLAITIFSRGKRQPEPQMMPIAVNFPGYRDSALILRTFLSLSFWLGLSIWPHGNHPRSTSKRNYLIRHKGRRRKAVAMICALNPLDAPFVLLDSFASHWGLSAHAYDRSHLKIELT